ncbi:MAG: Unknown protein [uncultured Sulfurovum sp.]|uniref:Uncharacterized protein n=1 Tax=uncultured Sulfurovum sp. TaxID=269237 RepID=A0A6S6T0E7_9BACT|nr:MAG: Unknown protein [uncultured Sulfurovum sp.]
MDNLDKALTEMVTPNTILYDAINKNLGSYNLHKRDELISEIAISLCSNRKKINKIIEKKEFLYYFLMILRNQIKSSTSSFHKNCRETITSNFNVVDKSFETIDVSNEDEIEYNQMVEGKRELVKIARESVKVSWFDAEIFKLYFDEGMTYREIEGECGIDHCLAWHSVKSTKKKLIKRIKNLEKTKKY